ncbi:hypothetical protein AbraIFM66951_000890 [Aspergillus brasiliensis]|uniref:Uncharacterized protein n=1 Tax=Aspergillus brasiliensis TaxID=319629 RepID=A0A9W6DJ12_9EURO|nr:hypothetical protein AbraCBS73388_000901 [Aspergillus brasiliensis]GKZ42183.1 hypothetical protein AbraIFM66951_000890 [Aspergillus brasiliensis]
MAPPSTWDVDKHGHGILSIGSTLRHWAFEASKEKEPEIEDDQNGQRGFGAFPSGDTAMPQRERKRGIRARFERANGSGAGHPAPTLDARDCVQRELGIPSGVP